MTYTYKIEADSELPHQQRVIDEAKELGIKTEALQEFINNNKIFLTLDNSEQLRLKNQFLHMTNYFLVLVDRINNF